MSETDLSSDFNSLIIIEDEIPAKILGSDNSDDNESNDELFDFSDSDIKELVDVDSETQIKRNSLHIIEEKDSTMNEADDLNNNSSHRLSLQVESGDDNSLVMTNEAVNRTIIRIGSNRSSVDFGEAGENVNDSPNETINHDVTRNPRRSSEGFQDDDGEVIVNILGQINDIVGSKITFMCRVNLVVVRFTTSCYFCYRYEANSIFCYHNQLTCETVDSYYFFLLFMFLRRKHD